MVATRKSIPGPTWQESSVKKIETKKVAGWAGVRATKIEARGDGGHSIASSASVPTSALKSAPPREEDKNKATAADKRLIFDEAKDKCSEEPEDKE